MDYWVKFEELRSRMLNSHPTFNESCFVLNFVNGLNNALRSPLKMICPTTIEQAAEKEEAESCGKAFFR